jgi:hypothetical protein
MAVRRFCPGFVDGRNIWVVSTEQKKEISKCKDSHWGKGSVLRTVIRKGLDSVVSHIDEAFASIQKSGEKIQFKRPAPKKRRKENPIDPSLRDFFNEIMDHGQRGSIGLLPSTMRSQFIEHERGPTLQQIAASPFYEGALYHQKYLERKEDGRCDKCLRRGNEKG